MLTPFDHLADASHRLAAAFRAAYAKRISQSQRELEQRNTELSSEVAERTRVADALARSEERLRLAMEATAFGIFEWDIANDVVRCSPNVKRQFGFSSESELTLDDVLDRIHPDDREAVHATMRRALDPAGARIYGGEFRTLRPDGSSSWIDARGAVMFSQLGKQPQSMVGIVLDITERKEREMQLHRTAAELGASNRMKDEFMATLAHELRNPLAPIRNGLEILSLQGLTNPTQRRACDIMGRQVKHIVHLVDDLLDISRINRRKLGLKKEIVHVQQLIDGAVETILPQIEAAKHELQVSVPKEPVVVHADPVRIIQAIGNLLANSTRYTPAGGRIQVCASLARGGVEIRVTDNGIGITPNMLPHIFDMFSQDTASHSEAGLGIGLALTKALIEMHGGSVQAQSDGAGAGSSFWVWLPISKTTDQPRAGEPDEQAPSPRRRVLVVDDNADAADSTAALLGLMGHEVHAARDGLQAIEAAREFAPDLILMDIGMPGLDGYEAARRIRHLSLERQPTIVALTGWDPEHKRPESPEAVFDVHVVKPVDAKSLAQLLSALPRATH